DGEHDPAQDPGPLADRQLGDPQPALQMLVGDVHRRPSPAGSSGSVGRGCSGGGDAAGAWEGGTGGGAGAGGCGDGAGPVVAEPVAAGGAADDGDGGAGLPLAVASAAGAAGPAAGVARASSTPCRS